MSCSESLTDIVNTMGDLSSTTTLEDLLLAATSINDVVGNLLEVSVLARYCLCLQFTDLSSLL